MKQVIEHSQQERLQMGGHFWWGEGKGLVLRAPWKADLVGGDRAISVVTWEKALWPGEGSGWKVRETLDG